MTNHSFAKQLQSGLDALLKLAAGDEDNVTEKVDSFEYITQPGVEVLAGLLSSLQPHASIFETTLEYTIDGQTEGSARLTARGLQPAKLEGEYDREETNHAAETADKIEALLDRMKPDQPFLTVDALCAELTALSARKIPLDLKIYVWANKNSISVQLVDNPAVSTLCFFTAAKFLEFAQGENPSDLYKKLLPKPKPALVLLLGDVTGSAQGPNLAIWGRDYWPSLDLAPLIASSKAKKIPKTVAFRGEECQWDISPFALTPFHLHLDRSDLDATEVTDRFNQLCDDLCVPYLANRTCAKGDQLQCVFRGQKRTFVNTPVPGTNHAGSSLYKLFDWAFENHSSDKLGIVRQILSISLTKTDDENYPLLLERSAELLGTAKSNFQLFLRRSVELYFDKRMRVSEYLQKFSQAVSEEISNLTSEMVSNLYKTVGLIIGAVIASLIEPGKIPQIVALSAGLYFIYVLFITLYQLPSIYIRFENKRKEYNHGIAELRDILAAEELETLQGNTFQQASRTFTIYFFATVAIYVILAFLAIAIMAITLAFS